jgi:hypothetical protein
VNREQRYGQAFNRLEALKQHAFETGDGVQATKLRKIKMDLAKLLRDDETPKDKECD